MPKKGKAAQGEGWRPSARKRLGSLHVISLPVETDKQQDRFAWSPSVAPGDVSPWIQETAVSLASPYPLGQG
jgi:hypothetical protein